MKKVIKVHLAHSTIDIRAFRVSNRAIAVPFAYFQDKAIPCDAKDAIFIDEYGHNYSISDYPAWPVNGVTCYGFESF